MKKLIIIFLLIASLLLTGCIKSVVADTTPETVTVTSIITQTSIVTIEDTQRIDELEAELKQYEDLIGNLNELLKNVYIGYASNSNGIEDGFTAFSIKYQGKFYLITAGHCVENKYGKFGNFKFRANFSDNWIYPKLVNYDKDVDYAIFYSDKIIDGFKIGQFGNTDKYVLGNVYKDLNLIKNLDSINISGESGSPIVDINGNVIGIMVGGITNILKVTQAINNLK